MKLKYRTKYILSMVSIGCISLALINFAPKDNSYKTVEEKTSRIIIESPKKGVNDEGTSVTVPSTYGKPVSPVQPLPPADPNALIVITPLS